MLLLTSVFYLGAAFGFYIYLLGTAQVMPEEFVEATMPSRDELSSAPLSREMKSLIEGHFAPGVLPTP